MRKSIIFILLISGLFGYLRAQEAPQKGLKQLSEPLIEEYINFLASDEMRGRSAPSTELDKSAQYIAAKLKDFGIQSVHGSYFQQIPFCYADLDIEKCRFAITKQGTLHSFTLKENFTPLFNTGDGDINGELVFAEYGITAPEYNYDDYKNIDVTGKIVLVLKNEPQKNNENAVFDGVRPTNYSDTDYKIRNAAEHGAIGFLLVTDPLNNLAITAQGYLWNSLYVKRKSKPVYNVCKEQGKTIPAAQVNRDVIDVLFGSVDSLRMLQENIDKEMLPSSFIIPNASVNLAVSIDKKDFPSSNVIGWIEGSDAKLKDEYIIIGAHYDHIGISSKSNHLNDSIMNGADDNASGTAAVIAVAKAFAEAGKKPARSVIFMLFTAEERGLIGSDYYTKNPLFPLEKTVAMINMDMVGRNGNDTLYVIGEKYNPELAALVNAKIPKTELKKTEMKMDLYGSSDYYPFYKKGISAIGFTSGLHEDYHRVGDNPDKINHIKVRRIAQLAYRVAWKVANTNTYFTIIEK